MAQERINRKRQQPVNNEQKPASKINSKVEKKNDFEKVCIVNGANSKFFDLTGKTVGYARKFLRDLYNISEDAVATMGSKEVDEDLVLEAGDRLEFSKETGVKGTKIQIRWLIKSDMPEVLKIERGCFQHPWSQEEFEKYLKKRNCIGMIADYDGEIVGFMIYELFKNHIYLHNFAVDSKYHKQQIGTAMMDRLKEKLACNKRKKIKLKVRETNLPAQLFFKSQDFVAFEVERCYFDNEDAYNMKFDLIKPKKPVFKNRITLFTES